MSESNVDIKYELIPYDGFIGSQEFDFDKTIYDLHSANIPRYYKPTYDDYEKLGGGLYKVINWTTEITTE